MKTEATAGSGPLQKHLPRHPPEASQAPGPGAPASPVLIPRAVEAAAGTGRTFADRTPAPGGGARLAACGAQAVRRPLGLGLALAGRRALGTAMPGRAPLRVARGTLGSWLLGGLWVCALSGLCGLGAGGSPGTPRPCEAPQQWEGRQVLYRQSSGRNSRALLSYDGLNQRVRVLDERKALIPCKRYAGHGGARGTRPGRGLRGCAAPAPC